MTQKEKLIRAAMMAQQIKNIANRLRYDANDYDVKFPLEHASELERLAEEFLGLEKTKRARPIRK